MTFTLITESRFREFMGKKLIIFKSIKFMRRPLRRVCEHWFGKSGDWMNIIIHDFSSVVTEGLYSLQANTSAPCPTGKDCASCSL